MAVPPLEAPPLAQAAPPWWAIRVQSNHAQSNSISSASKNIVF